MMTAFDSLQSLARRFAYDHWANRAVLESLKAQPDHTARAHRILSHLVGAHWLWLRRLGETAPEMAVWPTLTLDDIAAQLQAIEQVWSKYLASLKQVDLAREISYVNSLGQPWTSTVGDIVEHVLLHDSYHRGQIATLLAEAGIKPPYTDYIECTRRGLIE